MQMPKAFDTVKAKLDAWRPLFFWYRHHKAFFFLGFLAVLGLGGWYWYYDLYRYQWGADEKKQYLDASAKETSFKGDKFRAVVESLKRRAARAGERVDVGRDLFDHSIFPSDTPASGAPSSPAAYLPQ